MAKVTANDLLEKFQFELLAGEEGIYRPITTSDISRPGIEMAGFLHIIQPVASSSLGGRSFLFEVALRPRKGRTDDQIVYV